MNVAKTYERYLKDYGDETVAAVLTLAESILVPRRIDDELATIIQRGVRQGLFGYSTANQRSGLDTIIRGRESMNGSGQHEK